MNVGSCGGRFARQYAMNAGTNSQARDAVPWMQMLEQKKKHDTHTVIKNR
jgi:hypothetical protein